jgi:regulator of replication initiation timing
MADWLAQSHINKQVLESQVAELVAENNRLNGEVHGLQSKLAETLEKQKDSLGAGKREAESAARERLLKDEFERKIENLQVELNRVRQRATKQIEEMQTRVAGCICGGMLVEQPQSSPAEKPKRWIIRNSK